MALQQQIERCVEQRVAGADKGSLRLARWRKQALLKGDALIARQHRLANTDHAVAVTQQRRNMGDLVAARLALAQRATQLLEGRQEEGLDIVRLEAAGLSALHLLAHPRHLAGVHCVVGQRPLLQQILDLLPIHGVLDRLGQAGADIGSLAVADSVDEQFAQRLALKLELAQHIEDLAAQGGTGLFELL